MSLRLLAVVKTRRLGGQTELAMTRDPRRLAVEWRIMLPVAPLSTETRMTWWPWNTSMYGDWRVWILKATAYGLACLSMGS